MKSFYLGTACILALAASASADTFSADLTVTSVVVHPDGATMQLGATLDLPAGRHEVILSGIGDPYGPALLPLDLPQGVRLISARVATDRLPVVDVMDRPDIAAARAEVARLEAALTATDDRIALLEAPIAAARAQIATLTTLGQSAASAALTDADAVAAIAARIGQEVGRAETALEEASAARRAAERARDGDVEALDRARQALAALTQRDEDRAGEPVAILTLDVSTAGATEIGLTTDGYGTWSVSYQADLDTSGTAPALDLERRVTLAQQTGRDWDNVSLTLATTSVHSRTEASTVAGRQRVIYDPAVAFDRSASVRELAPMAAPVVTAEAFGGAPDFAQVMAGENILYAYPEPVTLRSNAEAMVLDFGTVDVSDVALKAVAAPQVDSTAYRELTFNNASAELLLAGPVDLVLDGLRVGEATLDRTAPGANATLPFGAIETMRLTSESPTRSEGGSGFFVRENEERTSRIYRVENFGARDWPLEVRLGLDYSQQDTLVVTHDFSRPADLDARGGANGLYSWTAALGAGDTWELSVDSLITWPDGMTLGDR